MVAAYMSVCCVVAVSHIEGVGRWEIWTVIGQKTNGIEVKPKGVGQQ